MNTIPKKMTHARERDTLTARIPLFSFPPKLPASNSFLLPQCAATYSYLHLTTPIYTKNRSFIHYSRLPSAAVPPGISGATVDLNNSKQFKGIQSNSKETCCGRPPISAPPNRVSELRIKNEKPSISRVIKSFQGFSGINFFTRHRLCSLRDLMFNRVSALQLFSVSGLGYLHLPPRQQAPIRSDRLG